MWVSKICVYSFLWVLKCIGIQMCWYSNILWVIKMCVCLRRQNLWVVKNKGTQQCVDKQFYGYSILWVSKIYSYAYLRILKNLWVMKMCGCVLAKCVGSQISGYSKMCRYTYFVNSQPFGYSNMSIQNFGFLKFVFFNCG